VTLLRDAVVVLATLGLAVTMLGMLLAVEWVPNPLPPVDCTHPVPIGKQPYCPTPIPTGTP
jgi:hypothetical protein